VEWFTAPFALAADALTYLWSVLWLARIRTREPVPDPAVVFIGAQQAVLLPFLVRTVGLTAGTVGVLFSLGSLGAVAGAILSTRLARRIGRARAMIGFILVVGSAGLLLPLTGPGWRLAFLVVGLMVTQGFIVAFNVVQVSYRQTICPDHLLGRMNATMRFVMWGSTPLGGLLGGVLGTALGLRTTMWITAVGMVLPVLWLVFSPVGTAAWRGTDLEETVPVGQGADAHQAEHVPVGAVPVDGAGLGNAVAVPVQQGKDGAGIPGQRKRVDVAAGAADLFPNGGGVLVDGGQQAGVAQGGDKTVDTDAGHELVEDGVGGEDPG
jgi:MFS family permease